MYKEIKDHSDSLAILGIGLAVAIPGMQNLNMFTPFTNWFYVLFGFVFIALSIYLLSHKKQSKKHGKK